MPTASKRLTHRLDPTKWSPSTSKHAIRYVQAAQEVCDPKRWMRIFELACKDAENEESLVARESGRKFISKYLIPPEPALLQQVFQPHYGLDELKRLMREAKEIRAEHQQLVKELSARDAEFTETPRPENGTP